MKTVEFENLIVGNVYYDIRSDSALQQVKMKFIELRGEYAYFNVIGDYNCYDGDQNGRIRFSRTHFYINDFKFGR